MCNAISKLGHDLTLFSRKTNNNSNNIYEYYGVSNSFNIVRCYRPNIKVFGMIAITHNIKKEIKKTGLPDLFYGRFIYGLFAVSNLGIPIIFESHTPPRNTIQRNIEKWLFKKPTFLKLVVISNALKKIYQNIFPWLPENKITAAHDGADLPIQTEQPLKETWSGRKNKLQAGYVGHLYKGRGINLIVDLAAHLRDVDFHIVGGNEPDIDYWKSKVENPKNLIFHGYVPHGMLQHFFSFFDIMLAPYQNQVAVAGAGGDTSKWMSPLKLFEYMAHGKAIIASDLPAIREILRHDFNALLVPANKIQDWEMAVKSLYNEEKRNFLGENGKQLIVEKYSWNQRARFILEAV